MIRIERNQVSARLPADLVLRARIYGAKTGKTFQALVEAGLEKIVPKLNEMIVIRPRNSKPSRSAHSG